MRIQVRKYIVRALDGEKTICEKCTVKLDLLVRFCYVFIYIYILFIFYFLSFIIYQGCTINYTHYQKPFGLLEYKYNPNIAYILTFER